MEFDIRPQEKAEKNQVYLPKEVLQDLGVIPGQFLQLKGEASTLVLEIQESGSLEPNVAYVSWSNFESLQGRSVEFKVLDVTLGCDPEFFILWGQRFISAATYLPYSGQVGADGSLGELRPMYDKHEDRVLTNLSKLIPGIPTRMRRYKWAVGFPEDGRQFRFEAHSYFQGLAAGFHVHLGIPPEILNTRKDFNRVAMNHLVQALDWYVSVPMVPLEVDHRRRLGSTSYGRPGDYRPSNVTLEYRTPGAFYLRSPLLARGLLGLSLMVAENAVSRMKIASRDFVNLHRLAKSDLQEIMPIPEPSLIREVLESQNPSDARRQIDRIRAELRELPTYGKHSQSVEDFFRVVDSGEVPSPNLLQNWKGAK